MASFKSCVSWAFCKFCHKVRSLLCQKYRVAHEISYHWLCT